MEKLQTIPAPEDQRRRAAPLRDCGAPFRGSILAGRLKGCAWQRTKVWCAWQVCCQHYVSFIQDVSFKCSRKISTCQNQQHQNLHAWGGCSAVFQMSINPECLTNERLCTWTDSHLWTGAGFHSPFCLERIWLDKSLWEHSLPGWHKGHKRTKATKGPHRPLVLKA